MHINQLSIKMHHRSLHINEPSFTAVR